MPMGICWPRDGLAGCRVAYRWKGSPLLRDSVCPACGQRLSRTTRREAEREARVVTDCEPDRKPFPHNAPGGWHHDRIRHTEPQ